MCYSYIIPNLRFLYCTCMSVKWSNEKNGWMDNNNNNNLQRSYGSMAGSICRFKEVMEFFGILVFNREVLKFKFLLSFT